MYIFVHSLLINTMYCESFDVVRFNLGPLLQGQTIAKLESAYNSLIIGPRGTYRKSWAANLLMWSNLTLGLCFQVKLDLRIGQPMQICIHQKDNSPKPVNHHLTLKEGPKVKSDIRRFPAHNKRVITTFKFGYPRLTLKEGS